VNFKELDDTQIHFWKLGLQIQ